VELRSNAKKVVSCLLFVLLGALALAAYAKPIQLLFGYEFALGSIFLLVAAKLYRLPWVLLLSTAVYGAAVLWLNESPGILLYTLQILSAAVYLQLLHKRSIFMGVLLSWVCLGAPVIYILSHYQTQFTHEELYILIFVSLINSLFNALIAELIVTYFPRNTSFPIGTMFYQMAMLGIVASIFWSMISSSRTIESDILTSLIHEAGTTVQSMENDYSRWAVDRIRNVKLGSLFETAKLRQSAESLLRSTNVKSYSLSSKQGATIIDTMGEQQEPLSFSISTVWRNDASSLQLRKPQQSLSQLSDSRWSQSSFIYAHENGPFVIQLEYPARGFSRQIYQAYVEQLKGVTFFALIIILFAIALRWYVARSLRQLADTTSGVPDKIKAGQHLVWPSSYIIDIQYLIDNFKQITERLEEMLGELQKAALHDGLTGLPNRMHFTEFLARKMEEVAAGGHPIGVLFVDLDRFKQINDSLGHDIGDKLLVEVAIRLRSGLDAKGFIARLGGDEFVVVVSELLEDEAVQTAEHILSMLEKPFYVQSHELFISASIGISVFPWHGSTVEDVIKNADTAMYEAKDSGGSTFRYYNNPHSQYISQRMRIEFELRKAIERNQLSLHYQPVVDAILHKVVWVEALLRWNHPELGAVSPAQFIPIAESSLLIKPIGEWVIREACTQAKAWADAGHEIGIGVNVSAIQFDFSLADTVLGILRETGVKGSSLKLEITEGVFIQRKELVLRDLNKLRAAGIHVWIDDFGTGYSSLSLLKDLPVDGFKIDQSFVRSLEEDSAGAAITHTIIQLAKGHGWQVIAEGVESRQQAAHLNSLGCSNHQGYVYSKPQPSDHLLGWLIEEGYVRRHPE
jgi:diguanylate cyclase